MTASKFSHLCSLFLSCIAIFFLGFFLGIDSDTFRPPWLYGVTVSERLWQSYLIFVFIIGLYSFVGIWWQRILTSILRSLLLLLAGLCGVRVIQIKSVFERQPEKEFSVFLEFWFLDWISLIIVAMLLVMNFITTIRSLQLSKVR